MRRAPGPRPLPFVRVEAALQRQGYRYAGQVRSVVALRDEQGHVVTLLCHPGEYVGPGTLRLLDRHAGTRLLETAATACPFPRDDKDSYS